MIYQITENFLTMDIIKYSKYIDHSPLKMDASESEVARFCKEAIEYSFHSVVVFPWYIEFAKNLIRDSDVKLDTVVGFPFGNELISIKSAQAEQYIKLGADEIDMVMNLSAFRSGKTGYVKQDIEAVLEKVRKKKALLKVIIEIELLSDEEIIKACKIVADAGADFVKTSVGLLKGSKPAEVEKVRIMYNTVSSMGIKVKASGSIHTPEKFISMIDAGASRIGTSRGIDIMTGLKKAGQAYDY
jgi:deoxyribose-phosphate aldolase